MARGKMSPEATEDLRGYQSHSKRTSVSIMPEEHELLGEIAERIGVSRSKVVGLAVRRYAVEMGLAELEAGDSDE